jgi:hypothetical protein
MPQFALGSIEQHRLVGIHRPARVPSHCAKTPTHEPIETCVVWLAPMRAFWSSSTISRRVSSEFDYDAPTAERAPTPCSAKPITGPGSRATGSISWIRKLAPVDRKATTSDASGEPGLEALELADPLINASHPFARKARPVASGRDPFGGKFREFSADFLKGEADPLREDDECHPAQHCSGKAAMPGARSLGRDEAALLVEAQCRGCNAAAA